MEGRDLRLGLLYVRVVAVHEPGAGGAQGEVGMPLELAKELVPVLGAPAHRHDIPGAEVHGTGIQAAGRQG